MAALIVLAMCIVRMHCITFKPIPTTTTTTTTISGTGSSSTTALSSSATTTTPQTGGHAHAPLPDILNNTFIQDVNVSSSANFGDIALIRLNARSFRNIDANQNPVHATSEFVKVSLNTTTTHLLTIPGNVSSHYPVKKPKISPPPLPKMKSSPLPSMKSSPLPRMKSSPLPRMKSSPLPRMDNNRNMFMNYMLMSSMMSPEAAEGGGGMMKMMMMQQLMQPSGTGNSGMIDPMLMMMLSQRREAPMSQFMMQQLMKSSGTGNTGMINPMAMMMLLQRREAPMSKFMMQQLMKSSGTGKTGNIDPMVMMMLSQRRESPMSPFMKLLMLQNVRGGNKPTSPGNDLFVAKKQINPPLDPHAEQPNSTLNRLGQVPKLPPTTPPPSTLTTTIGPLDANIIKLLSGNSVPANSSGTSEVDLMTELMRAMASAEQPAPLPTGLTPSSLLGINSAGKKEMNPLMMVMLLSSPETMENPVMKAMMYMQFGMKPTTAMLLSGVIPTTETQKLLHPPGALPDLPTTTRPPSTTPSTSAKPATTHANLPVPHNVIPGASKSGLWPPPNIMNQGIGPVIPVTPVRIPIAIGPFPGPIHGVSSSTGNSPPLDTMNMMMSSPISKAMLYMQFGMDSKMAMMLAGVIPASGTRRATWGYPAAPL